MLDVPTPQTHPVSAEQLRDCGQASPLNSQRVLKHRLVERQIGNQALQLAVRHDRSRPMLKNNPQ